MGNGTGNGMGNGTGNGTGNGMGNGMGSGAGSGSANGGTTGGTTSANCAALADCCQQLPPDYATECAAALQNVDDAICQDILAELQNQGVCP